jgi:hypothetical protein
LQQNQQIAYPEWTEYRKKNGLDPLGMQTGSVNIYQHLLPGISNVTLRMRYYGLYAWLARTYAKEIGDTNPKSWQRFVRRAEALYALVAQHNGGETGVAGVEWAQNTLEALAQTKNTVIDFVSATEPGSDEHYLQQAWGAYGAAYGSQLYEIGIFDESKGHTIPVPSEEIGDDLAGTFADGLSSVAAPFVSAIRDGHISVAALDKFADMLPSGIAASSNERTLYENILFAKAGLERPEDLDRRRSLLLLLALAKQRGAAPSISDVRWMLYAGYDGGNHPIQLIGDELKGQRWRWWVYHANDLLHICYEALLKYSLDVLGEYPAGISLSRLIGETAGRLLSARDDKAPDWESFLAAHPAPANCLDPDEQTGEFHLQRELMRKMRLDGVCEPADAWLAVKLLAILHNRVRSSPKDPREELGRLDASPVRSLVTERRYFDAHAKDDFSDFIARLIEERVIRRHLWVGLRKFRTQGDYTFLIETDDGRVRRRAVDGPVLTNPRLGPALTFLRDIHLINDKGLTPRGQELAGAS